MRLKKDDKLGFMIQSDSIQGIFFMYTPLVATWFHKPVFLLQFVPLSTAVMKQSNLPWLQNYC